MATIKIIKIEETTPLIDSWGLKTCKVCYEHFVKDTKIDMCEDCVTALLTEDPIIRGNWGGEAKNECKRRLCVIFKTCFCNDK